MLLDNPTQISFQDYYTGLPVPIGVNKSQRQRARLAQLYPDGRCSYCGMPAAATLDHVVPRAKRGGNGDKNCVPCCTTCNHDKGQLSLLRYLLMLAQRTDNKRRQVEQSRFWMRMAA